MAKVLDSETLDILYNDLVRLVDKKIKNIKDKWGIKDKEEIIEDLEELQDNIEDIISEFIMRIRRYM